MAIAISALITSISSIAIAVHHGQIMEKLVQANSFPYMQGGFSDATPDGNDVLSLDLSNRGVGPAHQESLRVKVGDRYVTSLKEFIAASLGPDPAAQAQEAFRHQAMWNRVKTRFIPGGQSQFIFRIPRTEKNGELWDRLDHDHPRWEIEYCYCSVFNDCWQVLGSWREPEPVAQCRREESLEFFL